MVVMQLLELKCGLAISWDTNGPGLNDPPPNYSLRVGMIVNFLASERV